MDNSTLELISEITLILEIPALAVLDQEEPGVLWIKDFEDEDYPALRLDLESKEVRDYCIGLNRTQKHALGHISREYGYTFYSMVKNLPDNIRPIRDKK